MSGISNLSESFRKDIANLSIDTFVPCGRFRRQKEEHLPI